MSFGVKNGPPTYHRAITKALREYLDSFMKIFVATLVLGSRPRPSVARVRAKRKPRSHITYSWECRKV